MRVDAGCPPATPCGKPETSSGSSGVHWSNRLDFGNAVDNKPFPFEYDAYDVPDQFDVYKSTESGTAFGDPVWTTKTQVSGYNKVSIPYSSSNWGTRYAKVKVTGNKIASTQWTFTMGCPGDTIDNSDREKDRKYVTFSLKQGSDFNIFCDNLTKLVVDGTTYISSDSPRGFAIIEMSVGGPHGVAWSYTCGPIGNITSPFPYLEIRDSRVDPTNIQTSPASFNVQ